MNEHRINESVVEQVTLTWPESLGYAVENGADIAPEEVRADALLPNLISSEWAVGETGRLIGYVV